MSVAYGRISPWATARVLVQLAWARTFSVALHFSGAFFSEEMP